MARIVVRCPFCKATKSIDNRKKIFRCDLCGNRIKLNECENVEDLKNFCINFYEDYKNDTIIDNTKDDVNE